MDNLPTEIQSHIRDFIIDNRFANEIIELQKQAIAELERQEKDRWAAIQSDIDAYMATMMNTIRDFAKANPKSSSCVPYIYIPQKRFQYRQIETNPVNTDDPDLTMFLRKIIPQSFVRHGGGTEIYIEFASISLYMKNVACPHKNGGYEYIHYVKLSMNVEWGATLEARRAKEAAVKTQTEDSINLDKKIAKVNEQHCCVCF
jgi:hypothetical protein